MLICFFKSCSTGSPETTNLVRSSGCPMHPTSWKSSHDVNESKTRTSFCQKNSQYISGGAVRLVRLEHAGLVHQVLGGAHLAQVAGNLWRFNWRRSLSWHSRQGGLADGRGQWRGQCLGLRLKVWCVSAIACLVCRDSVALFFFKSL